LLTQDGNPVTQELSYRFALNGVSILFKVNRASDPKKNYKKMRSAYSTRSAIVHGGEDAERDNKLQPATSTIFRNCATFLIKFPTRCILVVCHCSKSAVVPSSGWLKSLLWYGK